MDVRLSRIHYPVTTLGPGNRVGIWFQGCSIRCPGCISLDTWSFDGDETKISDVIEAIEPWLQTADGVTISGGEPFDQPKQLKCILEQLRTLLRTGDILVYSGYPLGSIQSHLDQMSGLIDALITEPFIKKEKQTLPLRGSDNQILHMLTAVGQKRYYGLSDTSMNQGKTLDIMFDGENTAWIAGIPQRGDLDLLVKLLHTQGVEALTTEDIGGRQ